MVLNKKQFSFRSSSGLCDIFAEAFYPAEGTDVKGVMIMAHGMAEHHNRYEDFIEYLNNNSIAVFMHDHLGHGKSVVDDSHLGFFGERNGYIYLVDDLLQLNKIAKEEFPNLPMILFGHSMGSFIARLYTEKYGDTIDGAIYCGTAGSNPAAGMGRTIVKAIIRTKGGHHRSKFVDKLAFGAYNNKIKPARTSFDWLTRDDNIVDEYIADPYCGFLFTAFGYRDLMSLIIIVNRPDWYTKIPSELPIYLVAGDMDPVGNYGKGINEVYNGLIDSKHSDVSIKLFPNDRHEILNELDKADVYANILAWIKTVIE